MELSKTPSYLLLIRMERVVQLLFSLVVGYLFGWPQVFFSIFRTKKRQERGGWGPNNLYFAINFEL
jgi:hypothetical protein